MKTKCMQCGGPTKKMSKGGMPTKVLGPAKKPFAAGMPFFTGAGQTGPEYMQKGGSSRAVQSSCKNGTVRDENGKCVMERKMSHGGSMKKYQDGGPTLEDLEKQTRREFLKGKSAKIGLGTAFTGITSIIGKKISDAIKKKNEGNKEVKALVKNLVKKGKSTKVMQKGGATKAATFADRIVGAKKKAGKK